MQINPDLKSLEYLGISGKGTLQFCEDLEFLGIPRNSQLYKLPITICGPEFQRTYVIAYSYFCLLYKCFSFVRRTLLCCHYCFKFSEND